MTLIDRRTQTPEQAEREAKWTAWQAMTPAQRDANRDLSDLNPQLTEWRGWRVEVVDQFGETRRFIVGMSAGWKPCHLELSRRDSRGGGMADRSYKSVRPLYKVRP